MTHFPPGVFGTEISPCRPVAASSPLRAGWLPRHTQAAPPWPHSAIPEIAAIPTEKALSAPLTKPGTPDGFLTKPMSTASLPMATTPLTQLLTKARTDVSLRRRLQMTLRFAIRQRLPVIESPTETQAERHAAELLASHRTMVVKDEQAFLVAADGTYQRSDTDPYRGLRAVAAGEVLGLTRTHSLVEVKRGMIVVTLVQPPRRDKDSIRMTVVRKLLLTGTDGEFDAQATKSHATRAEKQLAQRVQALRGVGSHSAEDWEIRRRVGVTITEIRSR